MLPSVPIKGKRGVWTAEVEGEELAVVHDTWLLKDGRSYCDPMEGVDVAGAKYRRLLGALRRSDRVVLQIDRHDPTTGRLDNAGYDGILLIENLWVSSAGPIAFDVVRKVADRAKK
jgi:hypothetical protein